MGLPGITPQQHVAGLEVNSRRGGRAAQQGGAMEFFIIWLGRRYRPIAAKRRVWDRNCPHCPAADVLCSPPAPAHNCRLPAAQLGPAHAHLEVEMHDVAGMQVSHAARDICRRLQNGEVVDWPASGGGSSNGRLPARGGCSGGVGCGCEVEGRGALLPERTRLQGVAKVTAVAELEDELHLRGDREGRREGGRQDRVMRGRNPGTGWSRKWETLGKRG